MFSVAADKSNEDEEMLLAIAVSMEGIKDTSGVSKDMDITNAEDDKCKSQKRIFPPLPEEPKADKNLLCRVGVRLPDGRRLQRNFLRTDPIQVEVSHSPLFLVDYLSCTVFYSYMKSTHVSFLC